MGRGDQPGDVEPEALRGGVKVAEVLGDVNCDSEEVAVSLGGTEEEGSTLDVRLEVGVWEAEPLGDAPEEMVCVAVLLRVPVLVAEVVAAAVGVRVGVGSGVCVREMGDRLIDTVEVKVSERVDVRELVLVRDRPTVLAAETDAVGEGVLVSEGVWVPGGDSIMLADTVREGDRDQDGERLTREGKTVAEAEGTVWLTLGVAPRVADTVEVGVPEEEGVTEGVWLEEGVCEGVTEAVAVLEVEGEAPRDRVALDEKEMEGVRDMEGTMEPPLRGKGGRSEGG